jgi:bifunctional NMN adenylyltransferase/nudix hydrolase
MKIGVIVGRFQTPYLTEGHKYLINKVIEKSDKCIVIAGSSPAIFTSKNPLPVQCVTEMIQTEFPDVIVSSLKDYMDDGIWSKWLDERINSLGYGEVTLYGSRDSFIPYYSGVYKTEYIDDIPNISATSIRNKVKLVHSEDFRKGIIYAVNNRFPICYSTVDIITLKLTGKVTEVLLGRKPNETVWRLPGGFVDPLDNSFEEAASRELMEETGGFQHHGLKYIGSQKINDWRYVGTNDAVITHIFVTYFLSGNPEAGDDLEELKWVELNEAKTIIAPFHLPLLNKVK